MSMTAPGLQTVQVPEPGDILRNPDRDAGREWTYYEMQNITRVPWADESAHDSAPYD